MSRGQAPRHVKRGPQAGKESHLRAFEGSGEPYARLMPRRPRGNVPAGIYHVTSRGNRRQPIFLEDGDQCRFMSLLGATAARHSWGSLGYCLMPNHYHLILETLNEDLSLGMHRLNSRYAHWFNRRHDVDGHLFQARFHAVSVDTDWHLLELCRYLPLNPVRAGLCEHPAQWPWSSYHALAHGEATNLVAVDRILRYFGRDESRAQEVYRGFVLGP